MANTIGEAVAALPARIPRILVLNGRHDRETMGMMASDVVDAIVHALNRRAQVSRESAGLGHSPGTLLTHLLVPENGGIVVDQEQLDEQGITRVIVVRSVRKEDGNVLYCQTALVEAFQSICEKV